MCTRHVTLSGNYDIKCIYTYSIVNYAEENNAKFPHYIFVSSFLTIAGE